MRIVVIMTSHNRVATTLKCLDSLAACQVDEDIKFSIVLADAGSSDGTLRAVLDAHPAVIPVSIPADKFWAEGMRIAWEQAQSIKYDYLLWLNDDVVLRPDALTTLLTTLEGPRDLSIAVGALVDPVFGNVTYSGFKQRSKLRPFALEPVQPRASVEACDTLNGNVVLIPTEVDQKLGGFPDRYKHSMADLAYGFDAKRLGIQILVPAKPVGECSRNQTANTWQDRSLSLGERFKKVRSPKGLAPEVWVPFCLRYGGLMGPILAVSPYARILLSSITFKIEAYRSEGK